MLPVFDRHWSHASVNVFDRDGSWTLPQRVDRSNDVYITDYGMTAEHPEAAADRSPLYGITTSGGTYQNGTVFAVTP
jgi:hypothetical protein